MPTAEKVTNQIVSDGMRDLLCGCRRQSRDEPVLCPYEERRFTSARMAARRSTAGSRWKGKFRYVNGKGIMLVNVKRQPGVLRKL